MCQAMRNYSVGYTALELDHQLVNMGKTSFTVVKLCAGSNSAAFIFYPPGCHSKFSMGFCGHSPSAGNFNFKGTVDCHSHDFQSPMEIPCLTIMFPRGAASVYCHGVCFTTLFWAAFLL